MIKVNDLNYKYEDGTMALKNINIDLDNGKIIGVIGNNGSGKSTLFYNLMGILKPTSGSIEYNSIPLKYNKKYLREYRKKIGMVFQDPDKQIFYSNVFDDVAFGLRNLKVSEDIVNEKVGTSLKAVDAYKFKDKPVHLLSVGQKKRVAIAGLLVMDCEVILFDEPAAGLDPQMTSEIIKIIKHLKQQGKKIIISSHNMDLIYEICDYGYILNDGEIIKEGKISEIFIENEILEKACLQEPWIVKFHKRCGMPLFRNENEIFEYMKTKV